MVILGIDPGFTITGFSVIKKEHNSVVLVDYGYVRMPSSMHLSERIGIFYSFFTEKINQGNITDIS